MDSLASMELASGWEFKRTDDVSDTWLPVQRVPTEVHVDLLDNGQITDPFTDLNELSARWVGEHSWTYRTAFASSDKHTLPNATTDLVFKGLDTFATVSLNDTEIMRCDNMFVEHRVSVGSLLKPPESGDRNTLTIVFDSPRRRGLELVEAHPEHRFIVHQTEISRGPVRKAQYQWGWDWGPILLTSGPWKPVLLETYLTRIDSVRADYTLSQDLAMVEVSISVEVVGGKFCNSLEAELALHGQQVLKVVVPEIDQRGAEGEGVLRKHTTTFAIEKPEIWWPHGYGSQPLYDLEVRVLAEDTTTVLTREKKRIGFRRAELIQEKDASGQSFYFRVNNVDVFAGGSCWIPADNFLTRITPDKYYDWVKLAREGNQSMLRVWGGGIYESDAFFDACDRLGLLVWQDFAFACANYPAHPEYLQSVETEARQNVGRLRHHPSLIIWAGNNEDYQIVERYGLEYNFEGDKDPQSWLKTDFPARYIYEYLLPKVLSEESPGSIYHPSSPWGNGTSTTMKVDPTVGDVHQWNVWHGEMRPLQNLPNMGGRFVSEFGMEAYPHVETLAAAVSDPAQRYPGSMAMDFHNKAIGHERRLLTYVAENFRVRTELEAFTHLTQVMQADAMSWAYKSWRRQWGGRAAAIRPCGGVLVWQLNDSWPTVSWAVVDYFLVKKPAFYAMKRALQPLAIGVAREFHDWTARPADRLWQRDTGHVDPTKSRRDVTFDVWVSSSRLEPLTGEVVLRFVSVKTGEDVRDRLTRAVTIEPNGTTDIYTGHSITSQDQGAGLPSSAAEMEPFVIYVTLWIDGKQISCDTSWPEPIKYLDLADRGVELKYTEEDNSIEVSAAKPVKGLVFSERKGVTLSDNGFDVIPGEEKKVVQVTGIEAEELDWTFVQQ
ncbi:glycoside hydrolase family 2 protein [Phialemonium atrogriseum]|uniref:Beta-mannosidase B n=1 Tax=Phialemonium atrogriseum TaxID=1093897 RepID=A0AAJ0FHP3_9PEZI|nr:glycoside hydrolase family 2 protein [Phialemonium atrogriseum]KAK1767937.1 glycoside hydrolase family 2 protein [Phialemonium atrogriseum]